MSTYPDEAAKYVLQCRAQSSQVRVSQSAGLVVVDVTPLPMVWSAAGP